MKRIVTSLALAASIALAGCETTDIERMKEMNPFKTQAPAPTTDGTTGEAVSTTTPAPVEETSYELPIGGENTISLAVTGCVDSCPIVNVLLDPDNYWQRTAPEGVASGEGREGLYNDVANIFQAQGMYAFQGTLNILPGFEDTCSDYVEGGQIFYISLSRNGSQRRVNFDTGCAGSASSDAAADAINNLITVTDYMNIVSGVPAPSPAE